jgi:four helix bundle protein
MREAWRMSTADGTPERPERAASYKDLRVWQEAQALAHVIYDVTEDWPTAERGGLCSQVRRAATSIHANIAEGNVRRSRADYLRFLDIANASLAELESHLAFAHSRNFIPPHLAADVQRRLTHTARLLIALIRALRRPKPR